MQVLFTNITEQFWNFVDSNYNRNYNKIRDSVSFHNLYDIVQQREDGIFSYIYIVDTQLDALINEENIPKEVFKTKLNKDGINVFVFENIDDTFHAMKDMMFLIGNKKNYEKINLIIKQINMFEDMEELNQKMMEL